MLCCGSESTDVYWEQKRNKEQEDVQMKTIEQIYEMCWVTGKQKHQLIEGVKQERKNVKVNN